MNTEITPPEYHLTKLQGLCFGVLLLTGIVAALMLELFLTDLIAPNAASQSLSTVGSIIALIGVWAAVVIGCFIGSYFWYLLAQWFLTRARLAAGVGKSKILACAYRAALGSDPRLETVHGENKTEQKTYSRVE